MLGPTRKSETISPAQACFTVAYPDEDSWRIAHMRRGDPGKKGRSEEEESRARGTDNGLGAAVSTQFAHEGIDVEFDCVLAHAQTVGNDFVGQTLGQQLEHF